MSTLDFYDQHAEEYAQNTQNLDMKYAYQRFLFYVPDGGKILDFGCGSGRDTKYFLDHGYDVSALDGSIPMIRQAQKLTGISIRHQFFQDFADIESYNGIFASASLLHLKQKELYTVFENIMRALYQEGCVYCSFKYGTFEGFRGERYYIDMDIAKMGKLITTVPHCDLLECWKSHDVRSEHKDELWLNFIVRRAVEF